MSIKLLLFNDTSEYTAHAQSVAFILFGLFFFSSEPDLQYKAAAYCESKDRS